MYTEAFHPKLTSDRRIPQPVFYRLLIGIIVGIALAVSTGPDVQAQDEELSLRLPPPSDSLDKELIYVPTPPKVVTRMLEIANITSRDTVYDLGSGDGRIVIAAAQEYGAYGVGVELDPERVAEARRNVRQAGVTNRVEFRKEDFYTTDISDATAVLLYLLPDKLSKLRPKLVRELDPGTPIVTHDYKFEAWEPEQTVKIPLPNSWIPESTVYRWTVPASGDSDSLQSGDGE